MNIRFELVKEATLAEFADQHGLEMVVKERGKEFAKSGARYYAKFVTPSNGYGVDMVEPDVLVSNFGDGHTPEEAIRNYGVEISEGVMRIGKEDVAVPRIVEAAHVK